MFDYRWKISNEYPESGIKNHRTSVMSTFACGGGSTMGYKLAGYDVVAANDIDPKMAEVYKVNHKPKQFFLCNVKELLNRDDLPSVDLLDGSPPCSVFSIAGSREVVWQKEKTFREGQTKQVLDDLFFDFIELAKKMSPKVIIAENVKGMIVGNAKWYTREIVRRFKKIGYDCQTFLLNSATMGVPQHRERIFFIANKDRKKIELNFNKKLILYKDIRLKKGTKLKTVTTLYNKYYNESRMGGNIGKYQSMKRMSPYKIPNTLTATNGSFPMDSFEPRYLYKEEIEMISSWPSDYNYLRIPPQYLLGMSVPPVMMANIANEVYKQLISGENQVGTNAIS